MPALFKSCLVAKSELLEKGENHNTNPVHILGGSLIKQAFSFDSRPMALPIFFEDDLWSTMVGDNVSILATYCYPL